MRKKNRRLENQSVCPNYSTTYNRIKELLGHASIKTTEIYLHAELKDIREAVEVLCQNPPKSGKKRGNLLHSRYTEKDDQESHPVSSLLSVN